MVVNIECLTKEFVRGQAVLKEMTVAIPKGQVVGVVGPDGAGKTTLLRLLAALLLPTSGKITIDGFDSVKDAEQIHQLTGYMPQRFGLYEDLTVAQNLHLYADLQGVIGKEREHRLERLLHFTALFPFTHRLARDLSGGMKQKLGLACALIKKPPLLLLDEPSVGIDPVSRQELWHMVYNLIGDGVSVVWSTAYLDEAQKCHWVMLLNEGSVLFYGGPEELTKRVEGRTFRITDIVGDRRKLLFDVLKESSVTDGVIQGQDLRFVMKEGFLPKWKCQLTPPRLEDAFIDILGGGPGGESALADQAPSVHDGVDSVISAIGLTKKFGSFTAIANVTLDIKKGEIFGLLGPNGAGKTTTFKMLCGLLKPTSGQAFVNGVDLLKAGHIARGHIGYMAQRFSLYGHLTVEQNLDFFAGIYNLDGQAKNEMIEIFRLDSYRKTSAEALPLGYKQRLALACANMHHPRVLFLDEPTSGVDPIIRREFWNHINGLVRKGVTVMVTTHFMDEAEYCDRIALVYAGKVIHIDTPNALKDQAKTATTPNPTLEEAFIRLIEVYDAKA